MTPREIRRMLIGVALIVIGLIGFVTCSRTESSSPRQPVAIPEAPAWAADAHRVARDTQ